MIWYDCGLRWTWYSSPLHPNTSSLYIELNQLTFTRERERKKIAFIKTITNFFFVLPKRSLGWTTFVYLASPKNDLPLPPPRPPFHFLSLLLVKSGHIKAPILTVSKPLLFASKLKFHRSLEQIIPLLTGDSEEYRTWSSHFNPFYVLHSFRWHE